MGLEHDRTFRGERLGAFPVVFHLRVVDDQAAVEPDRGDIALLDDAEGVPFAEGLVGGHEGVATGGAGRIVEKPSGAQVGSAVRLLRVEDLIEVPDLHLRRAAEVDARIGFRDRLIFEAELDVAEGLVRRRVGSRAGVDQLAILHAPVLRKIRALLGEVGRFLFAGQLEALVRIMAVPPREVLAVEQGAEAFGRRVGQERQGEQAGEQGAHLISRFR